MAIKYDAVAVQRYEQNGAEKKRYIKCGVVFDGAKGMSLKIESLPVPFDGWLQFYEPKEKDAPKAKPASDAGDDIPF
jgi:DNA topoisomerase IA